MSSQLSRKRILGGLVAAGVLTVGIAAPAMAFAEDAGTPVPSRVVDNGKTAPGEGRTDRRDTLAEELATELGVPQDKVESALAKIKERHRAERKDQRPDRPAEKSKADREAALKERLDKAVSDGKLTREQADATLAAVQAGVLPFWGGGHGNGWGGPKQGDPAEAPADGGQDDPATTK